MSIVTWGNRHIPAAQREYDTIEVSSLHFPLYAWRTATTSWGPLPGDLGGGDEWNNEVYSFSSAPHSDYRRFLWGLDFSIGLYAANVTPTNALGAQLDVDIYDGDPTQNGKRIAHFIERWAINQTHGMQENLCLEQPLEITNGGIFIIPSLRHFKTDGGFDSTTAGYQALIAGFTINANYVSIPPPSTKGLR